jgi:hypothetical protein
MADYLVAAIRQLRRQGREIGDEVVEKGVAQAAFVEANDMFQLGAFRLDAATSPSKLEW